MAISIDLIKQLRERTLAPLGDCKKALEEAQGDIDKAQEILKQTWAAKADKKAGRETQNGLVKFLKTDGAIVGVKLLCETDFVAKNDEFQALVDSLLERISDYGSDVDPSSVPQDLLDELSQAIKDKTATIGEAMNIGYVYKRSGDAYVYNHSGAISAVVFYDWDDEEVAKSLALQVAAMDPQFVSIDDVPQERLDELHTQFASSDEVTSKPEHIQEQIIMWKVHKEVQDEILLEQVSITDQSKKVKDILPQGFSVQSILRVAI